MKIDENRKGFATLLLIVLTCTLVISACGEEYYMRTTEKFENSEKETQETIAIQTSSPDGEEHSSDVSVDTTDESDPESLAEVKYYEYNAEQIGFPIEKVLDYFLGQAYEGDVSAYTVGAYTSYYTNDKSLVTALDGSMRFMVRDVGARYEGIAESGGSIYFSYQDAHLKNMFPNDPMSISGYEDVKKKCDEVAAFLEFPYDELNVYALDHIFLSELWFSGGPAWYEENKYVNPGERSAPFWNEDEEALLFVYRISTTENEKIGTMYNENVLTIIANERYGVFYVNCPSNWKITAKKEIEITSLEEAMKTFEISASESGIVLSDIEICGTEVVYSNNKGFYSYGGEEMSFTPFWKISFKSALSDDEFERKMAYDDLFRGTDHSEWYFLIPADLLD